MIKIVAPSILAFMLIGCGGSNGSSATVPTKINGVAVDDLIVDGVVKAYDKNDKVLSQGRTSQTDGSYTLSVDHEGLVILEVTCDEKSKMLNPTTNKKVACEKNLKLHSAAVVEEKNKKVEVNISPVSELVVQKMGDDISKDSFNDARSKVGVMFGLDPIAKNPTEGNYAEVISSFHDVAKENNTTLSKVISDIAKDVEDNKVGEDATTKQLIAKMRDKNISNPLANSKKAYELPDNVASMSDVEMAKEFFRELRKQAHDIADDSKSNSIASILDTKAKDLSDSFENALINTLDAKAAGDTLILIVNHATNESDEVSKTIDDKKVVEITKNNSTYNYTIKEDASAKYSGEVTLPENLENLDAKNFDSLVLKIDGDFPTTGDKSVKLNTDITLKKTNDGASLVIKEISSSIDKELYKLSDINIDTAYSTTSEGEVEFKSVKLTSSNLEVKNAKYSITGTLAIPTYVTNSSIASKGFMEKLEEDEDDDGDIYNSGLLPAKASFKGVIKSLNNDTTLDGTLNLEFLNAKTIDLTSEDQIPSVKTKFSGTIKVADHKELSTTLNYNNQNDKNSFDLTYSYDSIVVNGKGSFDKDMENGAIDFSNQNGINAKLTIKNGEVVYGKDSSVTKDGKVIGELQDRKDAPIIKYIDGTIESLI
jgi:hypothetical protein